MNILLTQLLAQNIRNPVLDNLSDLTPTEYFGGLIPLIISLIIVVGIIVFVVFFLMGGVAWITSGGDKMKMQEARSRLTTALVGLIILLCFVAVLRLFQSFFGVGFKSIEVGPYYIGTKPFPTLPPSGGGGGGGGGGPTATPVPPGDFCTSSSQCDASSFCSSNNDADGDGYYGEVTSGTGVCFTGLADCNESTAYDMGQTNPDGYYIHPGQSNYFEDPIPGEPGNFDYDCADSDGDGKVNDKWPRFDCKSTVAIGQCFSEPIPNPNGFIGGVPACGEPMLSKNFATCASSYGDSCVWDFPKGWVPKLSCDSQCMTGSNCGFLKIFECESWSVIDHYTLKSSDTGSKLKMPCK